MCGQQIFAIEMSTETLKGSTWKTKFQNVQKCQNVLTNSLKLCRKWMSHRCHTEDSWKYAKKNVKCAKCHICGLLKRLLETTWKHADNCFDDGLWTWLFWKILMIDLKFVWTLKIVMAKRVWFLFANWKIKNLKFWNLYSLL
jgi:hypothetical protein